MNGDDERYLAACHEAGHAIACCLRRVEVNGLFVDSKGYGRISFTNGGGIAYAFIAHAGSWAEARLNWTQPDTDGNTMDTNGWFFTDHVSFVMRGQRVDWVDYERDMGSGISAAEIRDAQMAETFAGEEPRLPMTPFDPAWHGELETRWSDIQALAEQIYTYKEELTFPDDFDHQSPLGGMTRQ